MSIGLDNNNPGNIRLSATKYLGEVQLSQNKSFKQFKSMAWGYRAIFVLLHTYNIRYGLRNIERIINRYAPPTENNTERYISFVSYRSGIPRDKPIDTLSANDMIPIVTAISRMENGVEAVSEDVNAGWELFIKHKP